MTIEELKEKLKSAIELNGADPEMGHYNADEALLDFINDDEVTKLYQEVKKWYA